ncbi:ubiquinol-cytochrome-c reductase complex assembly factor 3 [Hippopotamus amphibius kiboko]|uniref:ubiquinol-cytochrome-c reductase complex assembly factor 3 n=1 Tax=Hippopotamus amphibius kiboko TaxID=575201 RepID=UPI002596C9C4|nr:ubiquinol-cytochrome-c reductase complex assembly factor 3 [Hippopotamus amphibius kiboko]
MVSCVGRSGLRRLRHRDGLARLPEVPEGASLVARSVMATLRKALLAAAVLGAGAGVGTALFVVVTPGEQQKQAMLKEMPEQDPQRRDEEARTKELLLATLQEAAATQENVAWRKNWMSGGGGRSA